MNILEVLLPKFTPMWFAEDVTPAGGGSPAIGDQNAVNNDASKGDKPSGQDENKTVPLAALHEERTKRQELQTEIETLRQMMQNTQQQATQFNQQQYGQQQQHQYQQQLEPTQQLEELWENNPRQAVNAQIGQAFAYYDQVNTYVENQMTQAATKYKDFNNYREHIRRYVNQTPLQDRARPGVVDVAYYIVKGQNADAIAEQARQSASQQAGAAMGAAGVGQSMPGVAYTNDGTLSQEEKNVARVMGLSEEEYLANKKG